MKTIPPLGRPLLLLLVASLLGLPTAAADVIEVAQESAPGVADYDAHVLGYVNLVYSANDVATDYSYNVPNSSSYNGTPPSAVSGVSYLFLHHHVAPGEPVSLVVVHDQPNDGSGGNTKMLVNVLGDPDGAAFLVEDDPGSSIDIFTGAPGGSLFGAENHWAACCTDGFALGHLDEKWVVEIEFLEAPTGITEWRVFSGIGPELNPVIEPGRRVRLRPIPCAPAAWENYGKGWPGTLGVPKLYAGTDPIVGITFPLEIENSAGVSTPAVLMVGTKPVAIPSALGGTLLVDPKIVTSFKLPPGWLVLNAEIPLDPSLCGFDLYVQVIEGDKGATHDVSFTPGLALYFGN